MGRRGLSVVFGIIRKPRSFDLKLSAFIEVKVSNQFYKFQLGQ